MKLLKKYELVREYPGSPELGTLALELKATGGTTIGYIMAKNIKDPDFKKLKPEDIENYPEYWRKVN